MKKEFPTLYKKTSTGTIQFWNISTNETKVERPIGTMNAGTIITEYGQDNTDKPQKTKDLILHGKNIGKKNETTPYEQACAEALSRWQKQKKKGYVESKEAAEKEELDSLVEGGIVPMLAHKFSDHCHKIKYSAYVQPKLDGLRAVAILKDGTCTLWSRTRKLITGVPHINRAIEKAFNRDVTLDGELYNHNFKNDFEKIVSFVRQEEPADGYEVVQYHVYDVVSDDIFVLRAIELNNFAAESFHGPLIKVPIEEVEDEAQVMEWFYYWRSIGYEGCMVRNANGKYVNKRSYDLLKVKEFDDAEFEIVGIEEGRGKLSGHVGAFVCRMSDGKTFLAKMSGDTEKLREYFLHPETCVGKQLTVQFQGYTGANGVPRFPVGIAVRNYE